MPTNFGMVRARATCVVDGVTHGGQSDLFTVPLNGIVTPGEIRFDALEPIPVALRITAPATLLTSAGATVPLTVMAVYGDGSTRDVTTDPDVSYQSSNPATASVSAAGVVTAHASGPVLITVLREGVSAFVRLTVSLSNTDSDGDGIPDDVEVANGLDPNNPVDALEDPDHDGLTNFQELMVNGTKPLVADTDGDGINDGDEVSGKLGFVTNALLADTDGDGVRDLLEIQTGSDPTNPNSVNLAQALQSLELRPALIIVLTVNTIIGEASQQLFAIGHLRDGTTIDLTRRGTNYTSSDLTICNFGVDPGRVFGAMDGMCTITVANSGFSAQVFVTVQTFAPRALSFVSIPGFANNVDVSGTFAHVAAGSTGLQVVDVSNHSTPQVVASLDTPGNANDVKVVGTTAYVADGAAGLQIIDITNPLAPVLRGTLDTPGIAQDVAIKDTLAYVADGVAGLQIIDVSNPAAPTLRGTVDTPGTAKGVDVAALQALAVIADGTSGLQVVDVTDPAHPAIVGTVSTAGDARDVAVQGDFAFVADFTRSFTSVELTDPVHPVVRASTPSSTGGLLMDVAAPGRFAFGADVFFVNGVPIIDVSTPATPIPRAILDFSSFRDDNGTGIALDSNFVYLTAEQGSLTENGATGNTRLYIGQYLALNDNAGIAPAVQITSPTPGTAVVEGDRLPINVEATDDVTVAAVNFLVNGAVVSTDTSAPYLFIVTVPAGVSSLTLGATAIDRGGNLGVAQDVVVNVIPDPGTTVAGRVVDEAGAPVAGASVTCLGVSGVSGADGTFSLANVPTTQGDVQCIVTFVTPQGKTLTGGGTGGAPVRGGTTQAGDIIVTPVSFLPGQSFPLGGTGPASVAVADFNGDGKPDVVTANSSPPSNNVSVLLGNGNGTFQAQRSFAVGTNPISVAVADLNADGKPDIVTANFSASNDISVLLGNGDGTFQAQRSFAVGTNPISVAVADLNADGKPDVVTANDSSNDISVLLGNGDGTFQAQQRFAVRNQPRSIAVADFDGDGKPDVVTANSSPSSSNLSVLLGNGDGTFQAQRNFSSGDTPRFVAVADLNADGKPDIVAAEANVSDNLSVLLGNGDGTFQALRGVAVGTSSASVAVADLNADGKPDVVTANDGILSNKLSVLLGRGDGTFETPQRFAVGNFPRSIAVADFNSDGKPDVVISEFALPSVIFVLLQR